MNYDSMTDEQVREAALALGIKVHHKAKRETILSQIRQQGQARQASVITTIVDIPAQLSPEPLTDQRLGELIAEANGSNYVDLDALLAQNFENKPPVDTSTPEQVHAAVDRVLTSKAGLNPADFQLKFIDGGLNWHMRYRRGGDEGRGGWAEDTGTMGQRLSNIMAAASRLVNARKPLRGGEGGEVFFGI